MTDSVRELVGKAICEATPLIINGWRTNTIYSEEAMSNWREKACKIADVVVAALSAAGLEIGPAWNTDMIRAPKLSGGEKVLLKIEAGARRHEYDVAVWIDSYWSGVSGHDYGHTEPTAFKPINLPCEVE